MALPELDTSSTSYLILLSVISIQIMTDQEGDR